VTTNRVLPAALLGVGAILALVGVVSHNWIAAPSLGDMELRFSLRGMVGCLGPLCDSTPYTNFLTEQAMAFVMVGRLVFGVGLLLAVVLLAGALGTVLQRDLPGPVSLVRLGFMFSVLGLALAIAFVAMAPDLRAATLRDESLQFFADAESGSAWSFIVFLAAAIAGTTGTLFRMRTESTAIAAPPVPRGEEQGQATKPCPSCGTQSHWMPQYSRHYCRDCKKYV